MTANDIVKDLESVIDWFTKHGSNTNTAVIDISQRAIDVIERQRELIKRLWEDCDYFEDKVKTIKSEVIRELAERLKENVTHYEDECGEFVPWVDCRDIDNLVKEMTEGNNAE